MLLAENIEMMLTFSAFTPRHTCCQMATLLTMVTSISWLRHDQIDYILCSQRWGRSIQSAKTRLGAAVAQTMNSLLPNSKFRLKLKKVGKTTRSFRYDLNQIPYDYAVEVTSRFKGVDLVDRVPDRRQ